MKPGDVQLVTYIEYGVEHNAIDPKLKVGDHVRISKYKDIFAKGYTPNGSEEVFVITNVHGDHSFSTYAKFSEKLTFLTS